MKKNEDNFIQKCNGKYDIIGKYINNKTKIELYCNKMDIFGNPHGSFFIRPNDIIVGYGCPKCGGTKKYTTSEYIQKANYVHNNFFSYEKTEYKGANAKIIVTCPYHGDFEVKANNHLNGMNCKKCQEKGIEHQITKLPPINSCTKKLTNEIFIKRIKEKHPEYTFNKCHYINYKTKVILTCPIHGDFEIFPSKALKGQGCSLCARNKKKTTESFITECKNVHGDKFDYSKCVYKNIHTKVTIICKQCGHEFKMEPANHLHYHQGCPQCQKSMLERKIEKLLLTNNIEFEAQKKFSWLGLQTLDFYLPQHHIAIECQGIQHFQAIDFFGGNESFERQIKKDKLKLKKCLDNGVNILYFSQLGIEYPYLVFEDEQEFLTEIKKYESN